MSVDKSFESKSLDPAVRQMIVKAKDKGITTVWDRYEAMTPQCGFGDTGLCCRHCLQGSMQDKSVRGRAKNRDMRCFCRRYGCAVVGQGHSRRHSRPLRAC